MQQFWHPEIHRVLCEINAQYGAINEKLENILMSQSDIDAATAQIEAEVADIATQDAAILAAQNAFTAEIATLKGQGVNTTALVAATAQLLTAQPRSGLQSSLMLRKSTPSERSLRYRCVRSMPTRLASCPTLPLHSSSCCCR